MILGYSAAGKNVPNPEAPEQRRGFRTLPLFRLLSVMVLALLLCGCDVVLYSGMTETDVNEMVMVLNSNGITARKVAGAKGTWDVTVDERMLTRSLDTLAAAGLPRMQYASMGDVFKKEGMVSTPTEEKARLVYATSQELAGTIAQIDGVLAARVHIVLPEQDSFGNKISPSTASVFVKHRSDVDLSEQVSAIKRLVENSVRELKQESVSVFLFPSTMPPPLPVAREAYVLGFAVSPDNAGRIWLALIVGVSLVVSGGVIAALRFRKKKSD